MKHRLSHNQTETIQLTGIVGTGILPWVIVFISIKFLPLIWGVTGATLISGLTFYFSLRIYKAEFDVDFLYLARRLNNKKIDLKHVIEVRTFPFSIYLFLGHAYIISLRYIDANKQKKAFVISRGLFGWTPTVDSISEITLFRKYILEKKYGR
jgi:hypothetical protein